jgi:hypothetical protein
MVATKASPDGGAFEHERKRTKMRTARGGDVLVDLANGL